MKKLMPILFALFFVLGLVGCANQTPERIQMIEGDLKTYYEMSDGTWEYDGNIYKYRLVIKGTMPNAATCSTFTYLSNIESIFFERAYMAAGVSSHMNDYFAVEDAVLVDWIHSNIEYEETMPSQ